VQGFLTNFAVNGTGIVNNSSFAPNFTVNSEMSFNNASTAGNATFTNNLSLLFFGTSTAGNATITNSSIFGSLAFNDNSTAGNATITNNDVMFFSNNSTAGNATITNVETGFSVIQFQDTATAGNAKITNNDEMTFAGSATAGNATITNNSEINFIGSSTAGNATIFNNGLIFFETTGPGSTARLINGAHGGIDLSNPASTGTSVGSIEGAGFISLGAHNLTVGSNDLSTIFSGVIGDGGLFGGSGGSFTKVGSGTLTLTGMNLYTGATTINAGTLAVDGSIAMSSLTTVNSGGTLGGSGTVGNTQVNLGATFAPGNGAPGNSMTVAGNLAFQSGALYLVQIGSSATFANVTGTASLAGTVQANIGLGGGLQHQYTILQSNGLNGTQFSALITNLPANFTASLSYTADDVLLDLTVLAPSPAGLGTNQQNVIGALTNFFNNGGALPASLVNLFGLSGGNLANALSQLDGEAATDAEKGAFQLMTEFLGLMLDPFVYGRGASAGVQALGFAPDAGTILPPEIALAYAGALKAPKSGNIAPLWTAWGSAFGGSGTTAGDPAVGSNSVTAQTTGFAAGMDYHYSPQTIFGFALGGGGTGWNLAQGLGGGHSDALQLGVYGITHFGPAYLAGALAFTNNWFKTDRVALGDQLTASFAGQSFGARGEAGYRYAVLPAFGVAPYAALQVQSFQTPGYSETDLAGGGLGLSYNAMNASDTRSELGARFDDLQVIYGIPVLLRGRLAWAHDWVSNPALDAVFAGLPGASFVVNGAPPPQNSALASIGAELWLAPRWALIGKFDSELASSSQTYAGSGTLRYTW
jgi:autotransporter-associated beta strand protein